MHLFRGYRSVLFFVALLLFCSGMVLWQVRANQARHVELREALIVLQTKGFKPQAQRVYERLLGEVSRLSEPSLFDDYQRTLILVEPNTYQPENLIWRYHRRVKKELDDRSEKALARALKLAGAQ